MLALLDRPWILEGTSPMVVFFSFNIRLRGWVALLKMARKVQDPLSWVISILQGCAVVDVGVLVRVAIFGIR